MPHCYIVNPHPNDFVLKSNDEKTFLEKLTKLCLPVSSVSTEGEVFIPKKNILSFFDGRKKIARFFKRRLPEMVRFKKEDCILHNN